MKYLTTTVDHKGVRQLKLSCNVFPNKKEKDTQPDISGYDEESGGRIKGWRKIDKNGNPYYSMIVEIPTAKLPASVMDEFVATPPPSMDFDDRIPF